MNTIEFTATVTLPKGGIQCVTVHATNALAASDKLVRLGYINPRNITQLF